MVKKLASSIGALLITLTFSSPAYAADSLTAPRLSAEKNYMEGSNVTVSSADQSVSNLTDFKAVQTRKLYYFYSTQASCSSNSGYMVGGFSEFDIKSSGLTSASRTVTLTNGNANLYFCAFEYLAYSKTSSATWGQVYSPRVGALVNPYQIDWSIFAPKLILVPPIQEPSTVEATQAATPSAEAVAPATAPTGSKAIFDENPTLDSKIKVSVKSWDLKGNTFKSRTLKLRTCSDEKCNTKLDYFDVTASSGLTEKTASSFTMSNLIETKGQYVQILDALTYTDSSTGEEKTVRTYSEIKELISAASASVSESPAAAEVVAQEATPEPTQALEQADSSRLAGIAIGVLSTLLVIALLVIIMVLRGKKKEENSVS